MVQAAGLLLFGTTSGISVAGVALTTATTGALTAAGIAVNIGASLLLNTALSRSAPSSPRPEDVVQTFRSPVAPRQVHMGKVKVGGAMMMPPRAKGGKLYILLAQMHGKMGGRQQHFVDGVEVSLDADGYVTDDRYRHNGASRLKLDFRDGSVPQAANADMLSTFADWSANHRLDGIATTLMIADAPSAEKFNAMFPNRTPEYACITEGKLVEDPRTGIVGQSENNAVHLLDYLTSADGMALPLSEIDLDSFIQAADECDDQLASSEGVVSRYRISGTYNLTDPHDRVIQNILDSCDGDIYRNAEGNLALRVGKEISPTVTLDKKHLLEVVEWSNGASVLSGYTSLKSQYIDQELGFTSQTIDPYIDADLVSRYGREVFGPDPNFGMSPSHIQTRFLSKIKAKKDNPLFEGVFRYNLHALKAIGEDFVNVVVDFPSFGVQYSGPVKVTGVTLGSDLTYVDIRFKVIDPNTYVRSIADEGTRPLDVNLDDTETFPAIQGFAAGPSNGGVAVVWEAPDNDSLAARIEYQVPGNAGWLTAIETSSDTTTLITTNAETLNIRHSWVSAADTVSDFTFISNVAVGPSISPTGVSNLSAVPEGANDIRVNFNADDVSTIWKVEVYRNTVLILSQFVAPSEPVSFLDTPPSAPSLTYEVISISVDNQTRSTFASA